MTRLPRRLLLRCCCAAALTVGLISEVRADPVVIVSPEDGAVVPPEFTVKVEYGDAEWCDTDGCSIVPADHAALYVDTMIIDNCFSCVSQANFEVMLEPGMYELIAGAGYISASEWSEIITVTVQDAATTGGTSGSTGSTSGTEATGDASSAGAPGQKDGCACSTSNPRGPHLVWLALSCLWVRRRGASQAA